MNLPAMAGDLDSVPELGRSPGEGNGNPFQYSCLGNPLDRGAQRAPSHGVARLRHDLVTKPWPTTLKSILETSAPDQQFSKCGPRVQIIISITGKLVNKTNPQVSLSTYWVSRSRGLAQHSGPRSSLSRWFWYTLEFQNTNAGRPFFSTKVKTWFLQSS